MSIVISLRKGSAEGTKVALDNIKEVKEFDSVRHCTPKYDMKPKRTQIEWIIANTV